MNDDYLWDPNDPKAKREPEIERLENLLGAFRLRKSSPEWPEHPAGGEPVELPQLSRWSRPVRWLAVAAVLAVVLGGTWILLRGPRATGAGWEVERLEGTPHVDARPVQQTARLHVGQTLLTGDNSRARVSVGVIGEVEVEPNTRVRLLAARPTENRLALDRGTVRARIWAPPRLFYMNTPSGVAIDLGCRYTLQVDSTGAGLLRVTMGWVAFEQKGKESFVPAGATCATRPGIGPGTPYFEDSSQQFQTALAELDFGEGTARERADALGSLLAQTRKRDALTLWHLLARTRGAERAEVYERLAALVPPPTGVTREGILTGDAHMRDLWWDALGLGDTSWWRLWKGPVPAR